MKLILEAICLVFTVFIAAAGFSRSAPAPQNMPESIVLDQLQQLYEPVTFEHQMHSEMFPCSDCHHHLAGKTANAKCLQCHRQESSDKILVCSNCHFPGYDLTRNSLKDQDRTEPVYHIDIPHLKGALHLQCAGCHEVNGGPTGCDDCHTLTALGKQRFRVKQ